MAAGKRSQFVLNNKIAKDSSLLLLLYPENISGQIALVIYQVVCKRDKISSKLMDLRIKVHMTLYFEGVYER